MNVLVTESSYKHSLAIVRALGALDCAIYVLSYTKNSLAGLSKFTKEEILLDKGYKIEDIKSIISKYKIDFIIPVGINCYKKFVPWKEKLGKNIIISVDEVKLDLTISKKKTYKFAKQLGIPIPKTFYPKRFKELEILKQNLTYPCVIKGLYEIGGNIVDYAYSKEELTIKYVSICDKFNITEQDGLPMLQEHPSELMRQLFAEMRLENML